MCRRPREGATQSCSGATAGPWPAAGTSTVAAASRRSRRTSDIYDHTVLLRSDGTAVACGRNDNGQCDIPALVAHLTYTQVAGGGFHTVLLRSDGTAVACGDNDEGQCNIPALVAGLTYTQVSAGMCHTVLLRSDGAAVACGRNSSGQCAIPALVADLSYVVHLLPTLLLQASYDGDSVHFLTFGGAERRTVQVGRTASLAEVYDQLLADQRAGRLGPGVWRVDAILPDGRLLSSVSAEATAASASMPARAPPAVSPGPPSPPPAGVADFL
ncbi:unnamed protein product [Prorocentrum cordatum]|uniref:Uncharacterized protein n=1 Tax=Prorocentrum cordatum TaxID=2364126 RepID=A0ABN9SJZ6_9DINO|nr:unnamed protein product [Polarella glacialis]